MIAAVVGVLAVAAGCASGPAEPPPPPSFDPPVGFAAPTGRVFGSGTRTSGQDLDDLPATLVGTAVWATDGGKLARVDSVGAPTTVALPPGAVASGRPWASADGAQVLAGAATTIPGSGTTPPGLGAALLVIDPTSATVAATIPAALPWTDRPSSVRLRVAGAPGGLAVLTATTDTRRTTVGIDVAARQVRWTADGVDAGVLLAGAPGGPVAVGTAVPAGQNPAYATASVVGLDARTGQRRFGLAEGADGLRSATVAAAGPALAVVSGREARRTSLLGAPASLRFVGADGGVRRTQELGTSLTAAPPRCVWDEASTTVCADRTRAFAVDAATGAPLWALPDPAANRVSPAITTAWHGAVYGTTVNGPVVLDARTGTDRDRNPGAAPVLVNAYLAVAVESGGLPGAGGTLGIRPAVR